MSGDRPADSGVPEEHRRLVEDIEQKTGGEFRYRGVLNLGGLSIPILDPRKGLRVEKQRMLPFKLFKDLPPDDQLVTLDQIGAMVHRAKRTMRKYRRLMPPPDVPGGGSVPEKWDWAAIRPWMVSTFHMPRLPDRYPTFEANGHAEDE